MPRVGTGAEADQKEMAGWFGSFFFTPTGFAHILDMSGKKVLPSSRTLYKLNNILLYIRFLVT